MRNRRFHLQLGLKRDVNTNIIQRQFNKKFSNYAKVIHLWCGLSPTYARKHGLEQEEEEKEKYLLHCRGKRNKRWDAETRLCSFPLFNLWIQCLGTGKLSCKEETLRKIMLVPRYFPHFYCMEIGKRQCIIFSPAF